jgi:hypothetical protein
VTLEVEVVVSLLAEAQLSPPALAAVAPLVRRPVIRLELVAAQSEAVAVQVGAVEAAMLVVV